MKYNQIIKLIIFGLIMTSITSGFIALSKLKIDGSWKVVEVQTVSENGKRTAIFPNESLVIFSNKSYSFCWSNDNASPKNWQMTDTEKLARVNNSIVNSGTYEVKDSILITKALFAMNPMFTEGKAEFNCSFAGDTLILTGKNVLSKNNILHPLYANKSHSVTKLLRIDKK